MSAAANEKSNAGTVVVKPFVYGSVAIWQGKQAEETKTHRWSVYVRGLDNEDLSYFIKKVVFTLHASFAEPARTIEGGTGLFEVTEFGWGEFTVNIKVYFHDAREPPAVLAHPLKLFHHIEGQPITKKAIVSETYDEFVFVKPSPAFLEQLNSPPTRQFNDHPLAPHFTTTSFLEDGRKEQEQLEQVQASFTARIDDLRKRLYQIEQETAALKG